jgi:ATP-dependent exoDNAse (exonuclease V) beta subunit
VGPLNTAIYPAIDRCREQLAAPGCPAFGKDSVLDRESTVPFTSVCPGQHTFDDPNGYSVVWWDPAALELGRPANYGLRREELIAKDAPARVVQQGLERYHAWRVGREGAIERGSVPSLRVVTVRARAASSGFESPAETQEPGGDEAPLAAPVSVVSLRVDHTRPSGARFGALVHAVLGLVPLEASPVAVRNLVDQQVRVLGATPEEAEAAVPLVTAVLQHDLFVRARRAQAGGRLRRETPLAFLDDHGLMVEGVVDLAFEEDTGWTVVDFKTDQEIETGQFQAYLRQVALYAAAIGRATGRLASGVLLRL